MAASRTFSKVSVFLNLPTHSSRHLTICRLAPFPSLTGPKTPYKVRLCRTVAPRPTKVRLSTCNFQISCVSGHLFSKMADCAV